VPAAAVGGHVTGARNGPARPGEPVPSDGHGAGTPAAPRELGARSP
jgi:hypothetical protein